MVSRWKRELAGALIHPAALPEALEPAPEVLPALERVIRAFAMRVPAYYLSLIDPNDPLDPIALQCLPDVEELLSSPTDLADAVGDEAMSPVPGIVQKHANRVILLVSNTCTMYCRFCFRRPVAPGQAVLGLRDGLRSAFLHLEASPEIHEVILSGGDPLSLDDHQLEHLLQRLRAIPHVRLVRIHTRAPVTLPERVTQELASLLGRFAPIFLVTHFNHPRELSPQALQGLTRLRQAGISLLNQSVLLRRVNDSSEVLARLCWGLLEAGVTPYYLHHCDRTSGTAAFRTSIQTGQRIMLELKALVPGHGLPRYTLDLPGGLGKISLEPPYATPLPGHQWRLVSPTGTELVYQDEADDLVLHSPQLGNP